MNAGYQIFLFLFTFGVVCGGINALGIFHHKLPQEQYTISNTQVESTVRGAMESPLNFFTMYEVIMKFVGIILMGFLACFSLAAVFYAIGFPIGFVSAAILQIIQTPVTLVMLFFFYEQLSGRAVE